MAGRYGKKSYLDQVFHISGYQQKETLSLINGDLINIINNNNNQITIYQA